MREEQIALVNKTQEVRMEQTKMMLKQKALKAPHNS
jgi:hypothetical protein